MDPFRNFQSSIGPLICAFLNLKKGENLDKLEYWVLKICSCYAIEKKI